MNVTAWAATEGGSQIWAETPRDPELAEIAEQTTVELRDLLVTLLTPWSKTHAPATGTTEQQARAVADAVFTTLQGFLVRVSSDGEVSASSLANRTAEILFGRDRSRE